MIFQIHKFTKIKIQKWDQKRGINNEEVERRCKSRYRLVVRTGRCGRPDRGSILRNDIFLFY